MHSENGRPSTHSLEFLVFRLPPQALLSPVQSLASIRCPVAAEIELKKEFMASGLGAVSDKSPLLQVRSGVVLLPESCDKRCKASDCISRPSSPGRCFLHFLTDRESEHKSDIGSRVFEELRPKLSFAASEQATLLPCAPRTD